MHIKTHTIEIDHDELDYIGEGLILSLEAEMKCWKTYPKLINYCESQLQLLNELCDCGFIIYYSKEIKNKKGTTFNSELLSDPWKWAEKRIKQICSKATPKSTD